ncbi:MAG: chromosomal replication initiator protein DnaA [Candidatus Omnitrophota bacterium]
MSLTAVWEKAQSAIKEKVGSSAYETWFSSLNIKEKNPESLLIETPDEFFKTWVVDHYSALIRESLKDISQRVVEVEFSVNPDILGENFLNRASKPSEKYSGPAAQTPPNALNSRFTFDNFVIGSSNRFAHAASLAVAESPAKAYNPLFIYGGVGLGKTHLLQAIVHQIHVRNPETKHCYITSERFTNELIDAIRHRSTPQFRQKYRNVDVLLIDDIQFIAGKESTQEEFFHTFNALHNDRKQIIITSDRSPKEISNLEERLRSRFTWGLITDIQAPDFETRVAILRKKIEREPVKVPDEVINFIAQEIKTNIRELEGALIRVVAYSLLEEKSVSLDMAKFILKDMVKETVKLISIDVIQKTVADHFSISLSELKTKKRTKNVVFPRQIAMYLSRNLTNFSLPEIGTAFGGKDHTTVLHSWKKIDGDLKNDHRLKNTIENLITTLKQ